MLVGHLLTDVVEFYCNPRPNEMKKILVVEDNRVFARILEFNIEKLGFETSIAENGIEALTLLDQEDFDMIVTDYNMPVMNAREMCQRIRASARWAEIPVAMVTAKGLEIDLDRLKEEFGLFAVLTKPFSPKLLRQTVKDYFAGTASQAPTCATRVQTEGGSNVID